MQTIVHYVVSRTIGRSCDDSLMNQHVLVCSASVSRLCSSGTAGCSVLRLVAVCLLGGSTAFVLHFSLQFLVQFSRHFFHLLDGIVRTRAVNGFGCPFCGASFLFLPLNNEPTIAIDDKNDYLFHQCIPFPGICFSIRYSFLLSGFC